MTSLTFSALRIDGSAFYYILTIKGKNSLNLFGYDGHRIDPKKFIRHQGEVFISAFDIKAIEGI